MADSAAKQESYQSFTNPIGKNAKCFAGKTVLIHPDAQKIVNSLPANVTKQLNNQMSCIATTNISSIGRHKLYIETMSGLLEFVVSRKANRAEIMIEQVRYLKGLRKPWTGQPVKPTKHQAKKQGRHTLNIYYTRPIYSYPEERLRDFLLRVAPMMRGLTDKEHVLTNDKIEDGAEFASAIFMTTGSVKQYALILETQRLPHLSVATRKAPQGFRAKMNHTNGVPKRETIHTHGEMSWTRGVKQATEALIEIYGGSKANKERLMEEFYDKHDNRPGTNMRVTVRGDEDDFSSDDYANPGWLVTDKACLKYQKGSNTDVDMGCPQ